MWLWNFVCSCHDLFILFFKQKTAYEMRISDWSSDVCFPISHTATVAVHQARPMQNEGAGADAHERHFRGRRPLQVARIFGAEVGDLVDQPADHDDVIEFTRIAQALMRLHGDAAARCGRVDRKSTRLNSSH